MSGSPMANTSHQISIQRHHQPRPFKEDYLSLLRKFDIASDDKYVFTFIESNRVNDLSLLTELG